MFYHLDAVLHKFYFLKVWPALIVQHCDRGGGAGHLHLIIVLNSGLVLILVAGDSVDGLIVQRVDLALNWAQRAQDLAPCTRDRLQGQEALLAPCRLHVFSGHC